MNKSVGVAVSILTLLATAIALNVWLPHAVEPNLVANSAAPKVQIQPSEQPLSSELIEQIRQSREALVEREKTELALAKATNDNAWPDENAVDDIPDRTNEILSSRFSGARENGLDATADAFAVPENLQDVVTFWTRVFGHYNKDQVIFYNSDDVGIVYSVLDFSDLGKLADNDQSSVRKQAIAEEKARLTAMLKKMSGVLSQAHIKTTEFTEEEKRIFKLLYAAQDRLTISESALTSSLNQRTGLSDMIRGALNKSGQYIAEMKRIFRQKGLPEELTTIPFIESAFHTEAYSSADAAGIWQFIPATGRMYLKIDNFVDERYDPILATYAAASHLSKEYRLLGSWPLTINAYNTGPGRMQQAMSDLGTTDIGRIIKEFKGAGYGSDSRNYYPEFLAALEVTSHPENYFGRIRTMAPQRYDYLAMPAPVNLNRLIALSGASESELRALNPAIRSEVFAGEKIYPAGYLLKIPPQYKDDLRLAALEASQETRLASIHKVKRGETLADIAQDYGIDENALAQTNGLLPGQKLAVGTSLRLPDDVVSAIQTASLRQKSDHKIENVQILDGGPATDDSALNSPTQNQNSNDKPTETLDATVF